MNTKLKFTLFVVVVYTGNMYGEFRYMQQEVFTSSPEYTFEPECSALFLKPTASSLNYAAEAIPFPVPSPNWNIFDIHPGYHVGFDVGGKVILHTLDTNIMLHWIHLHANSSASVQVPPQNMVGPFFEVGPDAVSYKIATGKVQFRFDEVNLDYGQLVSFGERLYTNLFAGIGFTRIKQHLTSVFSSLDGTISRTIFIPQSFIGAGPQCGIDFSYNMVCGFRLTGKTCFTLLEGTLRNHKPSAITSVQSQISPGPIPPPPPDPATFASVSPALAGLGITPPNLQNIGVPHRSQLIPAFEESIGISYEGIVRECYMVKIEVGYQAKIYMNALQSVEVSSELDDPLPELPSVGVFARTFKRTLSNFALAGPYISFCIGF